MKKQIAEYLTHFLNMEEIRTDSVLLTKLNEVIDHINNDDLVKQEILKNEYIKKITSGEIVVTNDMV